jgi:hypothetical protein
LRFFGPLPHFTNGNFTSNDGLQILQRTLWREPLHWGISLTRKQSFPTP